MACPWAAGLLVALMAPLVEAQAKPPVPPQHTAALEPVLAQMAKYQFGQSREPLAQLTTLVEESMASPSLTRKMEARLVEFLQSDATAAGKQAVSQQLSLIAGDVSVSVLSAMLAQAETAEAARYALARIPGPKADEALRKGLDSTSGAARIGIINSLGQRQDAKAVPGLRTLLLSSDSGIAAAAIGALGSIGNRQAMDALGAARGKVVGALEPRLLEAYIQCAGRVAQGEKNKNDAVAVYQRLLAEPLPPMIHVAVLTGLATVQGKNALPILSAAIEAKDAPVQDIAIRLITRIPGPESTHTLMDRFGSLSASTQVRLLAALAEHGDAAARPLLSEAAKGNASASVRIAALEGLGRLGDASSVELLAEAAASGKPAEQAAARQSLYALVGPAIDSAIVTGIAASSGSVKIELIVAAGERGSKLAADALTQAVHDANPDVRRSALRALRNVAGPVEVPALLEIVTTSETPDRRDGTQALAAALRRSPPAEMSRVMATYKTTPGVDTRVALIDAIGQTSSAEALPVLRDSLRDANPEIVRGAILALTGWSDPAPLPDLLAAAKTNSDAALQILSLRGCLKLMAIPSQRSIPESAGLLAEMMPLAKQPAEKKSVLALLTVYPCPRSLQLAEDSVSDSTVTNEAKASVERIKNALKTR